MLAIEIDSITKVYSSVNRRKTITALNEVSLNVNKGEIFGLLGPNGAGKTTLVKVLVGIAFATSGRAKIFGIDVNDYFVREKIGFLPENHRYPNYLNPDELLRFLGELSGIKDKNYLRTQIDKNLELVGLTKWRKEKIRKFSKGMLQRLGLAQALLNNPDILFLDEPTDGVDPIGRKEIRDLMLYLKNNGKTIFLNSHLLSEVEMICDRVAILNKGVLVREDSIEGLTGSGLEYEINIDDKTPSEKLNILQAVIPSWSPDKLNIHIKVKDINELNQIIDKLRSNSVLISAIKPVKTSLEEMFIKVIKETNEKVK